MLKYDNILLKRFLILSPIEQYLISTGKRLFKGYEDYNDIEKFVFDLETTGLDPETSRIFLIGCKSNKGFEELFDCEIDGHDADKTEVAAIAKFFAVINYIKPPIIGGYNSANFDWDFIFKRCEKLGVDITKLAKTQKEDEEINTRETILKLGNEVENYNQVNMFGYSIIDIIHAARKAQAIDSSMKSASLKYVCKYNKVNKKNRVYIKGDKISPIWKSDKKYYFDDIVGAYCETKPAIERMDIITREYVKNNPDKSSELTKLQSDLAEATKKLEEAQGGGNEDQKKRLKEGKDAAEAAALDAFFESLDRSKQPKKAA